MDYSTNHFKYPLKEKIYKYTDFILNLRGPYLLVFFFFFSPTSPGTVPIVSLFFGQDLKCCSAISGLLVKFGENISGIGSLVKCDFKTSIKALYKGETLFKGGTLANFFFLLL